MKNKKQSSTPELDNVMICAKFLTKKCTETNADEMSITLENFSDGKKIFGDYKIIIKKI